MIIVLILLAAGAVALAALPRGGAGMAVVTVDGKESMRIMLGGEPREYVVDTAEGTNTICVGGGKAWMQSADCPDRLCVQSGEIDKVNQAIVCLPHRVVVRIEGTAGEGGVDGVAQ